MAWLLADRRDPALLVIGADNGCRTFTREAWRARTFTNPDAARDWATRNLLGIELEACVLKNARPLLSVKRNPAAAGQPSGAIPSTSARNENDAKQHCTDYRQARKD